MISKGVMKLSKGTYKVGCSCGSPECDLFIMVDNESINLFSTLSWNDYTYINNIILERFYGLCNRFRTAVKVLFTGKFELSSELIIIDKEHAENIAKIFNEFSTKG